MIHRACWLVLMALTALVLSATPSHAAEPVLTVVGSEHVVTPTSSFRLVVEVRNPTSASDELVLELGSRTSLLATRSALASWAEPGPTTRAPARMSTIVGPLAPGETRTVTVEATATTLGLPSAPSSWGTRAVSLALLSPGGGVLALEHTFLVWHPEAAGDYYQETPLAVLVPLVSPELDVSTGRVPDDALDNSTSTGSLAHLLPVAALPGVSWALDTALLTSSAPPPAAPTTDDALGLTPAPDTALLVPPARPSVTTTRWRQDLLAAAPAREVLLTPYADADPFSLTSEPRLWNHAGELATAGASVLADPSYSSSRVAVLDGAVDGPTAELLASTGHAAVVEEPTLVPVEGVSTPRSHVTVTTPSGSLDALVVESVLSQTLTTANDVSASVRLSAELAVITRERPNDPRPLLLALPRGWSGNVSATTTAVSTALQAPWVDPVPVTSLLGSVPGAVRTPAGTSARVSAEAVAAAGDALAVMEAFAPALTDDSPVHAVGQRAVSVAALSQRSRQVEEPAAQLLAQAGAVPAAVSVIPGGAVNVLGSPARVPVTVNNDLAQDVLLSLRVDSSSTRLVVAPLSPFPAPAMTRTRTEFEVTARANGDLVLTQQLVTPAGSPVGPELTTPVRVRQQIGSATMTAALTLAGLLLVVGVLRSRTKGSRRA